MRRSCQNRRGPQRVSLGARHRQRCAGRVRAVARLAGRQGAVRQVRAIRPSSHASPKSESAWVVPPGRASRTECGYSLRTSRLPAYGVAASSVSSTSRALAHLAPVDRHRRVRLGRPVQARRVVPGVLPGQERRDLVDAVRCRVCHVLATLCGHWTSVHCDGVVHRVAVVVAGAVDAAGTPGSARPSWSAVTHVDERVAPGPARLLVVAGDRKMSLHSSPPTMPPAGCLSSWSWVWYQSASTASAVLPRW